MGIAAARLALAWRQRSLAICWFIWGWFIWDKSVTRLLVGASGVGQIIPQNANRCKTEPSQTI
jgi:hypothetical protein